MSHQDDAEELRELKALLRDNCEEYCEHLEGCPPEHVNGSERRWDKNHSRSLVTRGPKRGLWCDHLTGNAGTLIDATMQLLSLPSSGPAIRYAKRYFGIEDKDKDNETRVRIPIPQDVLQEREQKRLKAEAEAASDIRRRLTGAKLLAAESVPIEGTIAEHYLTEVRKIPKCRWPDNLRYHRRSNALLALVTTASGEITAVHRVYLDANGAKLSKEDIARRGLPAPGKQTNGPMDGATVRLPGATDGPLFLGEGLETVMSLWTVSGCEVWATLGKIPSAEELPPGRRIFWIQDDDRDHSPRDKGLRKALRTWRRAGVYVTLAPPWAARRYNKNDWNDLLKQEGPDAVRTRLDGILAQQPPPPPQRTSRDLAQRTAAHAIGGFFRTVERFDAAIAAAEGRVPPVQAVHAEVGTGKTHIAIENAVDLIRKLRARDDKRAVVVFVPTHVLADEQVDRILPGAKEDGIRVAVWRGQSAKDPDKPGNATMCIELEMMRDVQTLFQDPSKTACAICSVGPNKGKSCSYLAQGGKKADIWLAAHNLLFERKPAAIGDLAAVVVDESPLFAALQGHESGHPIRLSLGTLRRDDNAGDESGELRELRNQVIAILDDHPDGPLSKDAFERACFTDEMARTAARIEWATRIEVEVHPRMDKNALKAALVKAAPNKDLGRRVMMWHAIAALLSLDGPQQSGWLAVVTTHDEKGARREIELKGRRTIKEGWAAPTLVLDATLRPELLRHVWPKMEVVAQVHVEAPHQRIRQVVDRSYSLSALDVAAAASKEKSAIEEQTSGADTLNRLAAERAHRARNLRQVHAIIVREARRYAPGRVLVVAQKRVEEALRELAWIPNNVDDLAHHNGIRGVDRWKDVRLMIVIGRTLPPASAARRAAEALTGAAIEPHEYSKVTSYREMADGSLATVEAWQAQDPIAEAIRWQACEGELVQITGRPRGVWRGPDSPIDILVMTDVPLPLPVHELIEAQDLEPRPFDLMMAAGGIAFENPTDAAAAYPTLWVTRAAAEKAMQRATTRAENRNLARVEYLLKGAGKRTSAAVFDPELIPDIATELAERLGPLANCHARTTQEAPPCAAASLMRQTANCAP